MFRPIRVDHTNCLQVAIKTHSFIWTAEEKYKKMCSKHMTCEVQSNKVIYCRCYCHGQAGILLRVKMWDLTKRSDLKSFLYWSGNSVNLKTHRFKLMLQKIFKCWNVILLLIIPSEYLKIFLGIYDMSHIPLLEAYVRATLPRSMSPWHVLPYPGPCPHDRDAPVESDDVHTPKYIHRGIRVIYFHG